MRINVLAHSKHRHGELERIRLTSARTLMLIADRFSYLVRFPTPLSRPSIATAH